MVEASTMSVFFLILVFLQANEQRKIVLKTKFSLLRAFLAVGIAVLLLVVFKQSEVASQIKLTIFAFLLVFQGFVREGLGQEAVIKLGVLAGDYGQYEQIELEETAKRETFVTFYKNKNHHFSILIPKQMEEVTAYFTEWEIKDNLLLNKVVAEQKAPKIKL